MGLIVPPIHHANTVPAPRAYDGLRAVDSSGRVTAKEVLDTLGWRANDRLEWWFVHGLVVVGGADSTLRDRGITRGGRLGIDTQGNVRLSMRLRRVAAISSGSRILLVARPREKTLVIFPSPVLDDVAIRCMAERGIGAES
ncbi:hypothetical protein [Nocardia sp. NBC_00403]|uniref:hypothetical protein n=1 Tax=Nocardia sp. NBC_00403 TaxID=2975990 RepID=UPI002E24B829